MRRDLAGFYISGGGITGAIKALRETGSFGRFVTIGYELMEPTRAALMDGVLRIVISHPLPRLAAEAISSMVAAVTSNGPKPPPALQLPFDIYTAENL